MLDLQVMENTFRLTRVKQDEPVSDVAVLIDTNIKGKIDQSDGREIKKWIKLLSKPKHSHNLPQVLLDNFCSLP